MTPRIAAQVKIAMGNTAAATALFESATATYEKETARPTAVRDQYRRRLVAIRKRLLELTPSAAK